MLTGAEFVRQSLETHLFFARIMKEHSFFLEAGFTPRDGNYTSEADAYRMEFDKLLADVISLSDGVISQNILGSGEIVTRYTLDAENASAYFTGIQISTQLTQAETGLQSEKIERVHTGLEQRVYFINQRATELINGLIQFKSTILANVLSCKMFTVNYPLLIDHILREAKFYLGLIQRLQSREKINVRKEAYEQEMFWNRIMAEHSKFIRGLLDPAETELFNAADNFGKQFDSLTRRSQQAMDKIIPLSKATSESLNATKKLRDFKAKGTQGLLECKIKSIIIPLLGDHVLREANHYLNLLKIFDETR